VTKEQATRLNLHTGARILSGKDSDRQAQDKLLPLHRSSISYLRASLCALIALAAVSLVGTAPAQDPSPTPIVTATWIGPGSGFWSDETKWQDTDEIPDGIGNIADGSGWLADFSTLDIAGPVNVVIDFSPVIGYLNIGDSFGADGSYLISADPSSPGSSLIFDNHDNDIYDDDLNLLFAAHAQLRQVSTSFGDTISAPILLNSSLDITNEATTATLTLSGTVKANGTAATLSVLSGSVTISGVISETFGGSMSVRTTNSGDIDNPTILRLTAQNTYSGGTFIDGGTILFSGSTGGANPTLNALGTGTVHLGKVGGGGGDATLLAILAGTINNSIIVEAGNGILTLGTTANSGTYTGTILLNGDLTVTDPVTLTLSGLISGSGSLTKIGAGALLLNNASSTYSGGTILNAGTLVLGANSVVNSGVLTSGPIGTATLTLNGGILRSDSATARTIFNNINLSGSITLGESGGGATGTGALIFDGTSLNTPSTVTLLSNATLTTLVAVTINDVITGNFSLTKAGASTLTLGAANTYNGTVVNAGTLLLTGSGTLGLTTGSLTITGGTLNLNGTTQTVGALIGTGGTILNNGAGPVTFTIGNGGGSGTYSGVIANGTGGLALTKVGTGTETLSGANSYTGATLVSAGILNIQSATGLGMIAGGTTVSSGATLQLQSAGTLTIGAEALTISGTGAAGQNGALVNVSGTVNYGGLLTLAGSTTISSDAGTLNLTNVGTITGSGFNLTLTGAGNGSISSIIGTTTGTLTKFGTGTWTLSGANTYSGITTIAEGTLSVATIGNSGASSNLGSNGTINIGSGTTTGALRYTGTGTTSNKVINLNGTTGGAIIDQSGTGLLKFTSDLTATGAGAKTLTLQGSTAGTGEISGAIVDGAGTTSLLKAGTGTWTLSGANTYSGGTTLSAGTLNINSATALGTGTFDILGGTTINNTSGSAVTLTNNNVQTWDGDFTFTGTNSLNLGTGAVSLGTAAGTTRTVTVTANTLTVGGAISNGTTANSLTKAGAGTLLLTGASTYDGATTINAGKLNVTGSLGNTAVTVNSGGALGGTGTVGTVSGGSVTVNSGGSINLVDGGIGTLTIQSTNGSNSLSLAGGSSLSFEIGSFSDQIVLGNNTSLLLTDGTITINIFGITGFDQGTYTLMTFASMSGDGTFVLSSSGSGAFTYSLIENSNSIQLLVGLASAGPTAYWRGNQSTIWNTINGGATNWYSDQAGTTNVGFPDSGTHVFFSTSNVNTANLNTTLGEDFTIKGLTFLAGGTAVTIGGANTLTLGIDGLTADSGAPAVTLSTAVALDASQTWTTNSSNLLTVSGVVSGAFDLTKAGTGTLVLSGANTYTGLTTVSAGILNIQNAAALGTADAGTTVTGGATLQLQNNIAVSAEALTLNGAGVGGQGALANVSGTNSWAGAITLASDSTIGSTAGTLTLTGGIDNGGFLLTFGGAGNTTVSTTAITGTGGLTKNGAGTLTLTDANNYTGATSITAGVVNIQNATALGTTDAGTTVSTGAALQLQGGIAVSGELLTLNGSGITNTGALRNISGDNSWAGLITLGSASSIASDAGTLTLTGGIDNVTFLLTIQGAGNTTISGGAITGTGGLTKSGAGTLTLLNANSYTGTTTVSAGILNIQNSSALGSDVAGTTVSNGATLQLQGGISVGAETLSINGTGVGGQGALVNVSGNNSWAGLITLAGASTITSSANTLTLSGGITLGANTVTFGGAGDTLVSGAITGTGGLTKNGTGLLTLGNGGTNANTYSGLTTVNAGELDLNKQAGTNAIGGNLTIGDGSDTDTVKLLASNQISDTSVVTLTNAGSAVLNLNDFDETIGALTDSTTGASGASVLLGAGTLTFGNSSNRTFSGVISGSGGIVKQGTGTETLAGASTYTGATTINAGKLIVNGSLGNTDVSVNGGAALGGGGDGITTGVIGGNVTVAGGTLSSTRGTIDLVDGATLKLTINGTLTLGGVNAGEFSTLNMEIGGSGTSDLITSSSLVVNEGGAVFNITGLSGAGVGTYTLLTFGSATGLENLSIGTTSGIGGAFSYSLSNDEFNEYLTVALAAPTGTAYWRGNLGGNWSQITGSFTNWYSDAAGTTNTSLPGSITDVFFATQNALGANLNTTLDQNFTINSLTILGTGSGSPTTTNAVTIGGGNTLTLMASGGNGITMQSGAAGLTISSNVALGASQTWTNSSANTLTVSGIVGETGGSWALTKAGTGVLTLTNANTYSGGTTLSAGTLALGSSSTVSGGVITSGPVGTGTLALNGGTLRSNNTTARTLQNNLSLSGSITLGDATNNGLLTFDSTGLTTPSTVTLTGNTTLTLNSVVTINNAISGAFTLTKAGTATLTLGGSVANTYSGLTTVNVGELDLNKTAGTNAIAGNLTIGDGTGGAGADIVKLLASNQIADSSDVTINSSGVLSLNNFSETIDGLISTSATASVTLGSGTLTVGANDMASATFAGVISGTGGLTKVGTGTQILSGVNTYSGATTLTNGILRGVNTGTTDLLNAFGTGTLNLNGGTLQLRANGSGSGPATNVTNIVVGNSGVVVGGNTTIDVDQNSSRTGNTFQLNTLSIGNFTLNVTGANSYALQVTGATTLTGNATFNPTTAPLTLSGVVSGGFSLTKTGTGLLTLSAANTYSGGTILTAGPLQGVNLANTNVLNAFGTGALNLNGGTLQLRANGTGNTQTIAVSNNVVVGGNTTIDVNNRTANTGSTFSLGTLSIGANTLNVTGGNSYALSFGATTLTGNATFNPTTANLTLGALNDGGVARTITKSGTGALTLGTNAISLVDGTAVNITGGTLNSNTASALGSLANVTVSTGATFNVGTSQTIGGLNSSGTGSTTLGANTLTIGSTNNLSSTFAGVISGTGAIIKAGTGTLTLSGTNTYSGLTTVSAGILNIQNAAALGATTAGTTVTSGATLQLQGGLTFNAEALTINGTGAAGQNGALVNVNGTNNYAGLLTLGSASTISSDSGTLNLTNAGTITGATFGLTLTGTGNGSITSIIGTTSGTLTKNGTGTWTLTGANTYTGATLVSDGILNIRSVAALGATASGTTVSSGATLQLQGAGITFAAEPLTLNGSGFGGQSGALVNVSGSNTWSGPITLGSASTIASDSVTLTLSGTINNGGFLLTVGGAGNVTSSGIISGAGGLTKNGAGTLLLSGANTYSGGTTLNAGTLQGQNTAATNVLQAFGTGDITLNGGSLQLRANGTGSGVTIVAGNNIVVGGDTTIDVNRNATVTGNTFQFNNLTIGANTLSVIGGNTYALQFAGTTTLTGDAIFNPISANLTLSGVVSGASSLTKNGGGALTLAGLNTYSGGTTLNAGALNINSTSALGTGTFTINGGTINNTSGGAIILSTNNLQNWNGDFTFTGANNLDLGTGAVTLGGNRVVTVSANTLTVGGAIGDEGNTFGLTKAGTGTLSLTGASTYSGETAINGGKLVVDGSLANTNITVNSGGALGGEGSIGGTVTVLNLGAINLVNGSTGTLTIQDTVVLTSGSSLSFEIGSGLSSDKVAITNGASLLVTGPVTLNITGLSGFGIGTYDLLTFGSGLASGLNNFSLGTTPGGGYSFSLGNTTTSEFLTVSLAAPTATAFWRGDQSAIWNTISGTGFTNWYTDATGTTNTALPGSITNVTFATTNATVANLNTTLGEDFSINSLTILGAAPTILNSVTIGGGNLLTLGSGGLTVNSGAAAVTLSTNVALGASQTWTNNSANALTVSGVVSGAFDLTKFGTGTLVLSGTNTYSGATTINQGTLSVASIGNTGANSNLGTNGTINIGFGANAGTLLYTGAGETSDKVINLAGTTGGATITQSGTGLLKFTSDLTATGAGSKTLTLQGSTAGTGEISGAIVDGSGITALTKTGTGTWTLSGNNTYSGGTTLSAGTLNINNASALGTGTFTIGNVSTIDNTSGGALTLSTNNAQNWNANFTFTGTNNLNLGTGAVTLGANRTVTVSANTLTVGGAISGAFTLTKAGAGTLTLSGTNTYSGLTTVSAGALTITNSSALGSTAAGTTVSSGAVLQLDGSGGDLAVGAEALTLNGTGISSNGALRSLAGNNSWAGLVTLSGASNIQSDAGTLTLSGGINLNTFVLTIQGAGDTTVSTGAITGTGGLTKNDTGTLTLGSGGVTANTYTGTTTVNAGELDLNKAAGTNAIAGNLVIGDGSGTDTVKLLASDQIANTSDVTINSSGVLNLIDLSETIDALNGSAGASVMLGSGTLTVGANNQPTANFAGVISGTGGSFVKTGSGTQTFSGTSANTYTGLTTISAGELDLNKTAGVNAIGGNATVSGGILKWLANEQMSDSATLTLNSGTVNLNGNTETLGSFINNGGIFTTGAGGHLIGTGASITWSGGTNTINDGGSVEDGHVVITGGTNTVQGGGTLKILSGGTGLEMTGSTLTLNSDNTVAGKLLLDGNVTTFASSTTSTIASGLANTNPGTIDLDGGTRTFTTADGAAATDMNISAVIVNGGFTKAGAGLLDLSGANTYADGTTVDAGTLQVSGSGTLGASTGSLTVNGGTVDLNGTSQNVGALNGSSGTVLNNANSTSSTITVGNGDATGSYAGVLADNSGTGGTLAFTKVGTGTQTLTGANTYSGDTNINAGVLLVNNASGSGTGTSAVFVTNSGSTLGGIGTITGAVTVGSGANISPGDGGNNTAILSTGALTLQTGSNFLVDINGLIVGTNYDQLSVTGDASIGGSNLLLTVNASLSVTDTFDILTTTGTAPTGEFTQGSSIVYGSYTFSINYTAGDGNDIRLTVTEVPEPSTWIIGALALAALLYTQRRHLARSLKRAA
jgi:fibronectin-binding autotransporter adhesin